MAKYETLSARTLAQYERAAILLSRYVEQPRVLPTKMYGDHARACELLRRLRDDKLTRLASRARALLRFVHGRNVTTTELAVLAGVTQQAIHGLQRRGKAPRGKRNWRSTNPAEPRLIPAEKARVFLEGRGIQIAFQR